MREVSDKKINILATRSLGSSVVYILRLADLKPVQPSTISCESLSCLCNYIPLSHNQVHQQEC